MSCNTRLGASGPRDARVSRGAGDARDQGIVVVGSAVGTSNLAGLGQRGPRAHHRNQPTVFSESRRAAKGDGVI